MTSESPIVEPRTKAAIATLEVLIIERQIYKAPFIPAPAAEVRELLIELTESQTEAVTQHFVFDFPRIESNPFGEHAHMVVDFKSKFTQAERDAVVRFYNTLLADCGFSIRRYDGFGQEKSWYRFELALTPVTSR